MGLSFLVDEQISYVVAEQISASRHEISVTSVRAWRNGSFLGNPDESLLRAAREEGLTLVTYDRKTIPPVLIEWGEGNESHAGVIFVDTLTIPQRHIGGIVRALIQKWEESNDWDWTNRIDFLCAVR